MDFMTRIAAADQLTIDIQPERWRLLQMDIETDQERMLVEAAPGRPLRYAAGWGSRRRLPGQALPTENIRQVVLGWSETDQKWHLGLIVTPELAQERGSRWIELVSWVDADQEQYRTTAQQVGQALGDVIDLPFRLIPPKVTPEKAQPVRELPALPLRVGIWTLERDGELLQFTRSGSWVRSRVVRVCWYTLWMLVYVILSVATLTTDLALPNSGMMLPNPTVLPYLGLGAAAVLLALIIGIIYELLARPDRITVDPTTHTIKGMKGDSQRWEYRGSELESVYVSQVVGQRGEKRTLYHGEMNLHLGDKEFFSVLRMEQEEERRVARSDNNERPTESISPLDPSKVDTDLQAAGLYVAQALGDKPCFHDQRTH